jgi:DNA primase
MWEDVNMEIVKLIGDRLTLQENGDKFKSICPFHPVSEDFLTLLIDPDKQTYTCLKCGAHGGSKEFYEKYEGKN